MLLCVAMDHTMRDTERRIKRDEIVFFMNDCDFNNSMKYNEMISLILHVFMCNVTPLCVIQVSFYLIILSIGRHVKICDLF